MKDLRNIDTQNKITILAQSFIQKQSFEVNEENQEQLQAYLNKVQELFTEDFLNIIVAYTDEMEIILKNGNKIELIKLPIKDDLMTTLNSEDGKVSVIINNFYEKEGTWYVVGNTIFNDEVEDIDFPIVLTFGQELVGLNFNPSSDAKVNRIKELAAEMADIVYDDFGSLEERGRFHGPVFNHAINEILNAQMVAVKFLTLKYND